MLKRSILSNLWSASPSQLQFLHRAPITVQASHNLFRSFTSTPHLSARKKKGPKKDTRITLIRYHLGHPLTPRPLRFSRLRALRHWTIHRAWQLFRANQRTAQELELERQYNSMRDACESLRLIDENGISHSEATAEGKNVGKLYRIAMHKRGVWDGIPIEYAKAQTEFPSKEGWNHGWKR